MYIRTYLGRCVMVNDTNRSHISSSNFIPYLPGSMNGCVNLIHFLFNPDSALNTPLYNGASVTTEESMLATYLYAIRNKLSYQATSQLLDLMKIHLPTPNSFPRSFYKLKKHLSGMAALQLRKFCSSCLDEIPQGRKECSKRQCKQSCKQSGLSYYAVLPFQEHIEYIFEGT